jgi:hypothetical protein
VTRDPWADPATPTEQGPPYPGPPQYAYGPPPYGQLPSGYPAPYGGPVPWAPLPPRGPQRPGQVITAAVLAFVQAALVLVASLYVWFFASVAELAAQESGGVPLQARRLAGEGTALAVLGLLSAVLLVAAGITALNRRSPRARLFLLAAHAVQVALALYWAVWLYTVLGDVPGAAGEGVLASFAIFFAAGPVAALGLLLLGPGRAWFTDARRG